MRVASRGATWRAAGRAPIFVVLGPRADPRDKRVLVTGGASGIGTAIARRFAAEGAGLVFGGAFLDLPLEQHLTTYRVNTLGLVAMTHAFLPDLLADPDGHGRPG